MSAFGDLFAGIARTTRDELESTRREKILQPGDQLFAAGEMPQSMFYLRTGRLKVWRPSREGGAMTLYYMRAGDVPGLVSVCRRVRVPVTMSAVTPIRAEYWPANTIYRLFEEDARFAHNGLRIAAEIVELLANRLEDLTGANAEEQIARALLRLAGEHANWDDDDAVLIEMSRQDLADMTGLTLYTASRILSAWSRQGVIQSGRRRVIIRRPAALIAIAHPEH